MRPLFIIFLVLTFFFVILIVATAKYFHMKKQRLVQNISSMIGDHLVNLRNIDKVNSPMNQEMLHYSMNQKIDPYDDESAKQSINSMLDVVVESKRRSFNLPFISKDVREQIIKWANNTNSKSSSSATKLLTHVFEKNIQLMDQLISQSLVMISETDISIATNQMKTLSHFIDGVNISGLTVDPQLILLSPNDTIINKWLIHSDIKVKNAAEHLLKNIEELRELNN